jgi:peptide deformylase
MSCPDVTDIETQVKPYIADMERLVIRCGAGLSANQVGIVRRFFVMRDFGIRVVINPRWWPLDNLGRKAGEIEGEQQFPMEEMVEGCLSWPNRYLIKNRFRDVLMNFTSIDGAPMTMKTTGIKARIVQHECDHLDGGAIFPRPDSRRATNAELVGLSQDQAVKAHLELLLKRKSP